MTSPRQSAETERVLVFGSYDSELHPRIEVIYEGLGSSGVQTEQLNVPLGFSSVDRIASMSNPLRAARFFIKILTSWLQLAIRASRLQKRPIRTVIVGYLGHFDIMLAKLLFPKATLVLDYLVSLRHAAQDRSIDSRAVNTFLRVVDSAATSIADVVLVDTEENIATVPLRNRSKAEVVNVGANASWFRNKAKLSTLTLDTSPLQLIFFGTYSPLQGVDTIADAIIEVWRNEVNFRLTLVGDGPGRDWVEKRLATVGEKVEFIDWLPRAELIKAVQDSDVCLGIFGTSRQASRVVPNKVFQGSASGCAIVTSDTPPQRRLMADAALYVPAGEAKVLASVLMDLSADREKVRQMKNMSLERAAQFFSPEKVVAPLIGVR